MNYSIVQASYRRSTPIAFISLWKTDNLSSTSDPLYPGISDSTVSNAIKLPLIPSGSYNFKVYWGDESEDHITSWDQSEVTHIYSSPGTYEISMVGSINGFSFNNGGDKNKLISISQWGSLKLGNIGGYFDGCIELLGITDSNDLNLVGTTNLDNLFRNCINLDIIEGLETWTTSNVTSMVSSFENTIQLNPTLSTWNVGKVTSFRKMFKNAILFDGNLSIWNVSSCIDFSSMFENASSYNNGDIYYNPVNLLGSFTSSTEDFANPERGFYHNEDTDLITGTYPLLNEEDLIAYRTEENITVIQRLFYLNQYINSDIDPSYLANIALDFQAIRNAGLRVLVRFAYSNDTSASPRDATMSQILTHISQVGPILTANSDLIIAYQHGWIGCWGETFYTSQVTDFGDEDYTAYTTTQWVNRKIIVEAMLDSVPSNIPVQVRHLFQKQTMYPTGNDRIGIYNDAFLNDWGDEGTFLVDNQEDLPNIGDQDEFIEASLTVPVSGETNGVNAPRTDCINAMFEMEKYNWSLLNHDYLAANITNWQVGGCYEEIRKKLGYRIEITYCSMVKVGDMLNIGIEFNNTGYSRPYKEKDTYLILKNVLGETEFLLPLDIREVESIHYISTSIDISSLYGGIYSSYILIKDKELSDNINYNIRLANEGSWESITGYNNLNMVVNLTFSPPDIINYWNINSLFPVTFNSMFKGATIFDMPISAWSVSKVTNMSYMFDGAENFDQPIGSWDTSSVTDMSHMFSNTESFNQDLTNWDVSSVTTMNSMFFSSTYYNNGSVNGINDWDVSSVTDMSYMFAFAQALDLDLNTWNTSSVTTMKGMFYGNTNFNKTINTWNVSNVTDFSFMFHTASLFNQPLTLWDTSSATDMKWMFAYTTAFNGDGVEQFDIQGVTDFAGFMQGKSDVEVSTSRYDSILNSWALQTVQPNQGLNFSGIKRTSASTASRNILTSAPNNWTIVDAGI